MSKTNLIRRKYPYDDAAMLQFCATIHAQFMAHTADFTAFDASLNAAFGNDFITAINQARNVGFDGQFKSITSQHTLDVKAKMAEIREVFLIQKYFVRRAFADTPGIWNEFGFNIFIECRNQSAKMLQFITDLHESSIKYETELATVGFGATHISNILNLKNDLQQLITIQQLSKGQRYTATNQRIILLNTLWYMCRRVCNAAKRVYCANYGMYQMFLAPGRRKVKKEVKEEPA